MPYKNKTPNILNMSNSSASPALKKNMNTARRSGMMASAGTGSYQGRVREGVRRTPDRNKKQKFYNKRHSIPTGRDLTTPIRVRVPAQRERAGTVAKNTRAKSKAAKIEVKTTVKTINRDKEKFPVAVLFHIITITLVFLCLVYSHIVLHECFTQISEVNNNIAKFQKDEAFLLRQIEAQNKDIDFESIAVNELGMVKEELLFKKYVSVKYKDKVEIVDKNEGFFSKFTDLWSSLFSNVKK